MVNVQPLIMCLHPFSVKESQRGNRGDVNLTVSSPSSVVYENISQMVDLFWALALKVNCANDSEYEMVDFEKRQQQQQVPSFFFQTVQRERESQ